jgi:hypothetical protein
MPDDPLLEEYKILQSKIDKLGDNRFIIKGWSATIVIGLALGATAASVPPFMILFGIPVVFMFWLMELNQSNLQKALGRRAHDLEYASRPAGGVDYRMIRSLGKPLGPVPGVATVVMRADTGATGMRWLAVQLSDNLFYWMQALLLLAVFLAYSFVPKQSSSTIYNVHYGVDSAPQPGPPSAPAGPGTKQPAGKEPVSQGKQPPPPAGKTRTDLPPNKP